MLTSVVCVANRHTNRSTAGSIAKPGSPKYRQLLRIGLGQRGGEETAGELAGAPASIRREGRH